LIKANYTHVEISQQSTFVQLTYANKKRKRPQFNYSLSSTKKCKGATSGIKHAIHLRIKSIRCSVERSLLV
jgi:hypothetical protein